MRNVMMHPDSAVYNFPLSPLGDTSRLNKYLDYVYLLGDPHLGKKFVTGVPLNRRGDREQMQRDQFEDEVIGIKPGRHFHVCMGDLFDKFTVDNKWVDFAYETYRQASLQNPNVEYIIIQGNHDAARDSSLTSSFQIFAKMCAHLKNVTVLTKHPIFKQHQGLNFLFVPWVPFQSTSELLDLEFPVLGKPSHSPFAAFGHWDTKSYGEEECDNLIPFDHFDYDCCDGVVTGHYHKSERIVVKNQEIFVTGSMQPYAHGEERGDKKDPMYLTHPRQEVLDNLETDSAFYHDKVLRVVLDDGEPALAEIDCLSLTHIKTKQLNHDANVDVEVDSFNLEEIFNSVMKEKGVTAELTQELWSQL